ncbi:GNAT family N-acetyltransferase [bacterium]|nr:GNAT family N-acetyltransferase [bacterium]
MESIFWKLCFFGELSLEELYEVMVLRQEVFVVEQNCIFLDADGIDKKSFHLLGFENEKLVAYLRIVPPKVKYEDASIGRVVTAVRGKGFGKILMEKGIEASQRLFPNTKIRLNAQQRLENFYKCFGFEVVSEPYEEDGILHVAMRN